METIAANWLESRFPEVDLDVGTHQILFVDCVSADHDQELRCKTSVSYRQRWRAGSTTTYEVYLEESPWEAARSVPLCGALSRLGIARQHWPSRCEEERPIR